MGTDEIGGFLVNRGASLRHERGGKQKGESEDMVHFVLVKVIWSNLGRGFHRANLKIRFLAILKDTARSLPQPGKP